MCERRRLARAPSFVSGSGGWRKWRKYTVSTAMWPTMTRISSRNLPSSPQDLKAPVSSSPLPSSAPRLSRLCQARLRKRVYSHWNNLIAILFAIWHDRRGGEGWLWYHRSKQIWYQMSMISCNADYEIIVSKTWWHIWFRICYGLMSMITSRNADIIDSEPCYRTFKNMISYMILRMMWFMISYVYDIG
jgi:hypothetical protein